MGKQLSREVRLLDNFYKAVFERPQQKFNRVLRDAAAVVDHVGVDDTEVDIFRVPDVARYYEDLTLVGSDSDPDPSAYGIVNPARVEYKSGVLNGTQMFAVFRLTLNWGAGDGTSNYVLRFIDGSTQITLRHLTSGNWILERQGSTHDSVQIPSTHSNGDTITLAMRSTGTTLGISLNGAAWVSKVVAATTTFGMPSGITFWIGSDNTIRQLNGSVHWMFIGHGTIDDDDIAEWHARGNTDPTWDDVPDWESAEAAFLWDGAGAAHEPTRYGENIYV